ncbi:alpha-E domain-containing protein [Fontimonas sp. SYSU GA230001]|uniref:alpha-E domain-containing protein n=1 Tax=Fontimonas sp. SYSU GA230001 TaxID=3142450 RepID=UPI0032B54C68
MLSRVAEDLYWFGRYVQRAENTARLVSVHSDLVLDLPRNIEVGWSALVEILGAGTQFAERHGSDSGETNVVHFLVLDPANPGSVASSLSRAREILRTVRESLPHETWEHLNDAHLLLQEKGDRLLGRAKRQELLQRVLDTALMTYGILGASMNHDVGFQFLRLGTNLEQADMTTRIIDVRTSSLIKPRVADEQLRPFQNIQWMSVLHSLTAYHMYRRHERSRVTGSAVLRFLLQNREFPRALMFCCTMIGATLPRLPPNRAAERALERTRALVQDANIDRLLESGLHEWIDEVQIGLGRLHQAIAESYFRT